jgi:hypothetical protein
MIDLSKNQKRKLRELAIQAYENELKAELESLFKKFKEWENNKISSGELSHLIHEYDRGPSKNMFSYYNNIDPWVVVARAVAYNLLSEDEIPQDILSILSNSIELYRNERKESS